MASSFKTDGPSPTPSSSSTAGTDTVPSWSELVDLLVAASTARVRQVFEPARSALEGEVRKGIGLEGEPVAPCMDETLSFLPIAGAARTLHSDLPAMLIGGVASLFLQSLHPLAMAGVADHSDYRQDPLGRLQRTANYVGTVTYAS
ncbi:MAG: oxygenase MpaB family protein, partial [Actinomycetes bacterium]